MVKDDLGLIAVRPERMHLCMECGQCMAVCQTHSIIAGKLSYENDFFELSGEEPSENAFNELICSRRSVRNFKDKPVPKEILEKIIDAISFAPPSFPPHRVELVVINNIELLKSTLPRMVENYKALLKMMKNPFITHIIKKKIGQPKYLTLKNHLIPLLTVKMPEMEKGNEDALTRGAPALILFLTEKNKEDNSQNISIAATYGMLKVHSLGLGGSIMDIIPPVINRDSELRKIFCIPDTHEIVTSLIVGYPKIKYRLGIRRSLKSVKYL
jgi:nitroreductase